MPFDISRVVHHLERLIAIPSISMDGTLAITDYVARVLTAAGLHVDVLPDENGRDANIIAQNSKHPALVLSSHLDVVPVHGQSWTHDAFALTQQDGLFYGRGTTDMKGFAALTLALAEAGNLPPLVWAYSWGEEIGCQGIRSLLPGLTKLRPWGCIVGEPTQLVPVTSHKGRTAVRILMRGRPVHSSRADIGRNAIHAMGHLISAVDSMNIELANTETSTNGFILAYSTVQVNTISGGTAPNIVAGEAEALVEMRIIPNDSSDAIMARLHQIIAQLDIDATVVTDTSTPPFHAQADSSIVGLVCNITGNSPTCVSFATEAGLIEQAGIPTVVCGPGSIEQAHTADEFISKADLEAGVRFFDQLMQELQTV